MYLDREEGIGMPNRAGSRDSAAAEAVQAKAPLDPEILRRWRDPDEQTPFEEPEAEPRRSLPAIIPAHPGESAAQPEDKPAPRRIGRRKLALLGVLLTAVAIGGGWFG